MPSHHEVEATIALKHLGYGLSADSGLYDGAHITDLSAGTSSNGEWIGKLATTSAGATLSFGVGTGLTGVRIYGRLVMSSTAGNFQLQWAQNVSDASGTTLKAGSFMTMNRVA